MEKETRNSIILFLILSFVPMWVFSYIYYIMKSDTILLVMMLLPAVASVITRVVRNEGFERMLLRPHLRRNLKWCMYMTNMLNMDRDVAIYARVSTEHEEQLSALENQKEWYRPILSMHPEWHFKRMYVEM